VCTTVCRPPRLRNVTLERRDGRPYYYRSVRDGEAVRKVYVASGELAQTLAHADEAIRHQREEERRWEREKLERLEALAAPLEELSEAAGLLARAHLVAAGCHRHNGEWRRRRGR
jgi:hypothetical protein